jgi:Tfp pilus assembly protein PilX
MRYQTAGKRSQQGLTLLVALIMLVMVTLLAASAFKTSNTNLKVVSSMQGRQEAVASAQAAIERVISTAFFTEEPTVVAATPIAVDINRDGVDDFTVTIAPAPKCIRTAPVTLGPASTPTDLLCAGSARAGAGTVASYCSDTIWEIAANTTDKVTSAATTVRQGVAVRVEITDAKSACK